MSAGRFPEAFLDELRAALPVSAAARDRVRDLKKKGAEWVGLSPFQAEKTPSFTVNDAKRLWKDFSSGKGGDVFKLFQELDGCSFVDAVKRVAELAGVPVPGETRNVPVQARESPAPSGDERPEPPRRAPATKREITAAYDYTDPDGGLLYQVCRIEWTEGDADGERRKTFLQRRHVEGDDGGWVWGLDAAEFVRGANGDWYRLTKDRAGWKGARLKVVDEVAHGLYRFQQLRDETAQPEDDRRIVFTPEGEKDCDTLAAWSLVATDSSGGSKRWSPHHADELRGCDVVVLMDNDASGREYAHVKARSLRGVARSVRVLDWGAAWASCPDGGDVTDWRDIAGGTRDALLALVDRLPEWVPEAPASTHGAIRFRDIDRPGRELEWLIKKVLTRGEVSMWFGPPGCGKSFLVTDAGLAIAMGVSWFGLRVRPGLVVYQAGEGGLGLKKRIRAWRQHHKISADEDVPFVLLPSRIDLFNADVDVTKLVAEIKAWATFYDVPLEMVVIDTFSAASPGANENASEDVSKVLQRAHRIAIDCRCHVAIVHHTPKAGGSPRGHSSLMGNVENAVEVVRHESTDSEDRPDGSRILRDVREFVVRKQKDAEDGLARRFVLRQVIMGTDLDGEPITSCVVAEISGTADTPRVVPKGYANLMPNNLVLMRALARALAAKGTRAPEGIAAPAGVPCVRVGDWIDALVEIRFADDPDDPKGGKLRARCKKSIERAYANYGWADRDGQNLIGKDKEWVWRTHRRVNGIDAPPSVGRADPGPLLAPGESADSIADLLS